MSWNLPDGCTDYDIDVAAGGYDEREFEEDDFDLEAYEADISFELVAEAQVEWSAAVFAEALAIPRRPMGREVIAVLEVIA
jgi:hypothetical protein